MLGAKHGGLEDSYLHCLAAASALLPNNNLSLLQLRGGASALARCGMLLGVAAIAYLGRNVLGIAESIVGAICAIQCSLMLPTSFFMALSAKQKRLRVPNAVALSAMLLFGFALLVWIVVQAAWDAVHHDRPAGSSR